MQEINSFYYLNKIFIFYGLESNTKRKWITKVISIITITNFAYNLIWWTYLFIKTKESQLTAISWILMLYFNIIAFFVYKRNHSKLYKLVNNLSGNKEDKNVKRTSLALSILWVITVSILIIISDYWVVKDYIIPSNNRSQYSIFRRINIALLQNSSAIYLLGSGLMEILVYMQSYYIFYCIKKTHFNNLSANVSENKLEKLQQLRADEFKLRSIEEKLNELIGFIPIVWLTGIFVRTCVNITVIATNSEDIIDSSTGTVDVVIYSVFVSTVIIIVGQLNSIYNINSITSIVNKSFSSKISNDQNFQLETIQYLIETTNRCNNKPKPFGLFNINSNLILGLVNAIVTFSVMCVQLKSSCK